jgi:hypothetical protein
LTRRSQQQAPESEADDDDEDEEKQEREQVQMQQAEPQLAAPQPPKLKQSDSSEARRVAEIAPHLTTVLPAGKVFPIQIGSELFRLSGASISSDGECSLTSSRGSSIAIV